jgi:hypothetical protein
VLALEIAEELEAALEQFAAIAEDLKSWRPKAQPTSFFYPRLSPTEDSNLQISKIIEKHPMNEDVATAHFLEKNKLGALVEEFDEFEWSVTVKPKDLAIK